MADNFGKWQGGPNFIFSQQWGAGKTNDGSVESKRFGLAGRKRRGRWKFNPNVTRSSHPGCQIALQAQRDKAEYIKRKGI